MQVWLGLPKALLIAAILRMMSVKVPHRTECTHSLRAAQVAASVTRQLAVERSDLDPVLVSAVAGKESSWRWRREGNATYVKGGATIVGEHGELGWFQVKPDGRATEVCPDLLDKLDRPDSNTSCAIRLLMAVRAECGGEPLDFLGRYNGQPCGPSDYARRVLDIYARGDSTEVFADVIGR